MVKCQNTSPFRRAHFIILSMVRNVSLSTRSQPVQPRFRFDHEWWRRLVVRAARCQFDSLCRRSHWVYVAITGFTLRTDLLTPYYTCTMVDVVG